MQLQSVRATSQKRACSSCVTPGLCDSKKKKPCTSRPLLSNIHTGTLCVYFSGTSASSRRVPGGGMALLQYLLGSRSKQVHRKNQHAQRGLFSGLRSVHAQTRRLPVRLPQSLDVIPELLCPRGGVTGQLPFARHALTRVQTCLPPNRCENLLVRQIVPQYVLRHSFGPARSTNSELHCKWHHSKLAEHLFVRCAVLLWLTVQEKKFILCETSILAFKSTEATKKCALYIQLP